jgi:hypothetical protein
MPKQKVVCGVKEPTKNERRGTMVECAEKKQIRYYGLKKVDKKIVDKMTKKKSDMTLEEASGKAKGLKTRLKNIKAKLEIAKKEKDIKKMEDLTKEFKKTKEQFLKIVPIANKLIEEAQRKQKTKK